MKGTVFFFAVSLAAHALILGVILKGWHKPEVRFFSLEPSVSVSLVYEPEGERSVQAKKDSAETPVSSKPQHSLQTDSALRPSENPIKGRQKEDVRTRQPVKEKRPAERIVSASKPERMNGHSSEKPIDADHRGGILANMRTHPQKSDREQLIGQADAPAFARFAAPEYPPKARRRNIEGRVLLRVLVGIDGRAREIEVVESSHPEFVKAAKRSALRSRYTPAKRFGLPEEVWVRIPFTFTLR